MNFMRRSSRKSPRDLVIEQNPERYPEDTTTEEFEQADELNSDGWDRHEKGLYREALEFYSRAIVLCPKFPMVWNNVGLAHFRLGDFSLAKEAYLKAIELSPSFIKPYSNLGILYLELRGDKDEAAIWFRKALELDPYYQRAKQYLALCETRGIDVTVSSIHIKSDST